MKASWDIMVLISLCGISLANTEGYKPVIIVHGLFDGPSQFVELVRFITKAHPGTNVSVIDLYDNIHSLKPMWEQVMGFRKLIYPIIQEAQNGVHLICFSQGGLVCRGLLSILPDHNVQSFISLSSPQAGQYGDTSYLRWVFPRQLKKNVFHLCYNGFGQKISICNYWNDPHHHGLFLNRSTYLALINGERPHSEMSVWRENFLRIKKLVLIGGPDDGIITPWQSSHFGFYDINETVVEMKDQDCYVKDTFGLKTLDARGDLAVCVSSGVIHKRWHSNQTVFSDCIEKWLN